MMMLPPDRTNINEKIKLTIKGGKLFTLPFIRGWK
jgi:hypothetical protein